MNKQIYYRPKEKQMDRPREKDRQTDRKKREREK